MKGWLEVCCQGSGGGEMGLILIIPAVALFLWLLAVLLGHVFGSSNTERKVEKVDIIEGGCIVEQQRHGHERGRRAVAVVPNRPLDFSEELNLKSIIKSGNPNVTIDYSKSYRQRALRDNQEDEPTPPPPPVDDQGDGS